MKTILVTSVDISEAVIKDVISQLQRYGIDVKGHFWEDDLKRMAWSAPRAELINKDTALWLILSSQEKLSTPSIRYGLSLLNLMVQAQRGLSFPIVIAITQGDIPSSETLPTPLKGHDFFKLTDTALYAKLVARIHSVAKEVKTDYRIDVYANPHIGQWFETGPKNSSWNGIMFGVSGAKILHHAVGPKGRLPERSVLNYPMIGMKINLGEKEYIACAVQNEIDNESSYFIKVEGNPDSIIFGPYSSEQEAEVYIFKLM